MALTGRFYSKEFRINAVYFVQVKGRHAFDVADELGIGRQTLYSWLDEARTSVLSNTSEYIREITPQSAEIALLTLSEKSRAFARCFSNMWTPGSDRPNPLFNQPEDL